MDHRPAMRNLLVVILISSTIFLNTAEAASVESADLDENDETLALLRIKIKNETGTDYSADGEQPTLIRLRIRNETGLPTLMQPTTDDTIIPVKVINETGGATADNYAQLDRSSGWSEWSTWTTCTTSCGGGQQTQTRRCVLPVCEGPATQARACNEVACAVVVAERLRNCTKQCTGDASCGPNSKCCTSDGCNTYCVPGSACHFDVRSPCSQASCRRGFNCVDWTPNNCGQPTCATIPKCVCPIACPSGQYRIDPQTGLQLCECVPPAVMSYVQAPLPVAPVLQAYQIPPRQTTAPLIMPPQMPPAQSQPDMPLQPALPPSLPVLVASSPPLSSGLMVVMPNQTMSGPSQNVVPAPAPNLPIRAAPFNPVIMVRYRGDSEIDFNDYEDRTF